MSESHDELLEKDVRLAAERGLQESHFREGWNTGYGRAWEEQERSRTRTYVPHESAFLGAQEQPVILRPGETAVVRDPPPGIRSIGTATGVSVIQALKDSGWDLEKIIVCWVGFIASLILLGLGLEMVFGVQLLAQGVAGFWSWWIQP